MNSQLPLYFRVLATLRQSRTVYQLAKRHKVSDKTIRREIGRLRRLGFDVRETVQNSVGLKTYRVVRPWPTLKKLLRS